jgi:hypothetical protein
MAEAVPPPPSPPVKEPDPVEGSEEWHTIEENKTKRKNFGAGIGFTSDLQIRSFVFEMTFKSHIDEATTVINLYKPHKNFIAQLFDLTTGNAHVMPTAKTSDDNNDGSTLSPLLAATAFPSTMYQHGKFFGTTIFFNDKTKRTVVRISHKVLMKESVFELKKKMMRSRLGRNKRFRMDVSCA